MCHGGHSSATHTMCNGPRTRTYRICVREMCHVWLLHNTHTMCSVRTYRTASFCHTQKPHYCLFPPIFGGRCDKNDLIFPIMCHITRFLGKIPRKKSHLPQTHDHTCYVYGKYATEATPGPHILCVTGPGRGHTGYVYGKCVTGATPALHILCNGLRTRTYRICVRKICHGGHSSATHTMCNGRRKGCFGSGGYLYSLGVTP